MEILAELSRSGTWTTLTLYNPDGERTPGHAMNVIGGGQLWTGEDETWVYSIRVYKDYRNMGFARLIMSTLLSAWATSNAPKSLHLGVSNHPAARALYPKMGFQYEDTDPKLQAQYDARMKRGPATPSEILEWQSFIRKMREEHEIVVITKWT